MRRRWRALNDAAKKLPFLPKPPNPSSKVERDASIRRSERPTPPKPLRREAPKIPDVKRRFDLDP